MPNDIIMQEITGDPKKWRVSYNVDAAGLKARKLNTANTFIDRDIDIVIETPAAEFSTSGNNVTVTQAGFIDNETVVGSIDLATIKSGTATITTATLQQDASNNFSLQNNNITISAPTVVTPGYISSTAGTKQTNTASLNIPLTKIGGNISISGTLTQTPQIAKQAVPSGVTDASNGNATTTAPSSGVYVAVKSATVTSSITATPNITTNGYGTSLNHNISSQTATVGANASALTYIPIKTTSLTQGTSVLAANGTTVTRGTTTWNSGWITSGTMNAAMFSNTSTSGVQYIDISDTNDAPILVSGDYLYINKGYTDNLKISLAKLVPNAADVGATTSSNYILSGHSAYNINGEIVAGSIPSLSTTAYGVSIGNDRIISAGQYLSGDQTIRALRLSSTIAASNTRYGVDVTIGDTGSATAIASFTGVYTGENTVSSGTAASAAYIVSGYTGWLNGEEVHGSLDADVLKTASATISGTAVASDPTIVRTNTGPVGTSVNIGEGSVTTSPPNSGYYVSLQPTAPATTINLTKTINTPGLLKNTNQITASASTTTKTGTIYYLPIRAGSCTVSGGDLSINGFTKNDLAITLSHIGENNFDANVIYFGTKNTATYPYYYEINGATPTINGQVESNVTQIIDTHTAGYIEAATETYKEAQSATATVSINSASATSYISLKKASMSVTGTNTVTPSVSINVSNITLSTTNNGISIIATGGGIATASVTASTSAAGYAPANTQLGSNTINSDNTSTADTKYITKITVPNTTGFELETVTGASGATEDQNIITITNKARRNVSITADAGGWVNINHPTTNGTDRIDAFLSDGTTKSGVQSIVTSGKWKINNITPDPISQLGPYYGATYVKAMSSGTAANITAEATVSQTPVVTTSWDASSISTTTSVTSYKIDITNTVTNPGAVTPTWKNSTAGYAAKNTTGTNGSSIPVTPTTKIVKSGTTNIAATIYIPAAVGTVTMTKGAGSCSLLSSTNVEASTTTNNSGVSITCRGSGSVSATAKITTAGYAPTTSSFATGQSTSSNTADQIIHINGVTLTKGKTFRITVPNGPLNSDGTNNSEITFVFTVANDNTGNVTVMGP